MSQEYWEERYKTGDMPWEKGAASPGVEDYVALHPATRHESVLVPGCGTGHDVRVWAKAGYEAVGLDIAPSAVTLSAERTREAGVVADFRLGDFLRDEPWRPFDIVFEHTCFCAIQPAERDAYVSAVVRWLVPGGEYIAVNYLIPDTDGPPFGVTRDEIVERFSPHFDILEEWVPRSYPNRTGLERMFRWKKRL